MILLCGMLLLVEDNAITRTALAEALRTSGQEVLEAGTAAEALALLEANPVRLVVTDFVLPDLDGLKFMDLIHQRSARMPIILISGYLSQRTGDAFLAASGKGAKFLPKPVRPSALLATVRALLNSAS